jgi:AmiR/NasT family two-component response regulator
MGHAMANAKRILLIDLDDSRRATRVQLLTATGYEVDVREDYVEAERLNHEGAFDLVIVSLHGDPDKAAHYSDVLCRAKPRLPILLLTDAGVFVPPGTLSRSVETGNPADLIQEIAGMLSGSTYVSELPITDRK